MLSDQNASLLSYNIMEEGLVKILLHQDYQTNKFCPIICGLLDHMIGDRTYKWPWALLYKCCLS